MSEAKVTCHISAIQPNIPTFRYSRGDAAAVASEFHHKLVQACEARGISVADDTTLPSVEVIVTLNEIDEGSQYLRYLLPFLAGSAGVRATAVIRAYGSEPIRRVYQAKGGAGVLGGSGTRMISGCLQRIAVQIAGHIGAMDRTSDVTGPRAAVTYLAMVVPIAVIVSIITTIVAGNWARHLPTTSNSIKPDEIPMWTLILGFAELIGLLSAAISFAPRKVLNSTVLLWLLSISGVSKSSTLRIVVGCFAALGVLVVIVCLAVARGQLQAVTCRHRWSRLWQEAKAHERSYDGEDYDRLVHARDHIDCGSRSTGRHFRYGFTASSEEIPSG